MTITAPIVRREHLLHNALLCRETAGPIREALRMNLLIEDLARDRMRRTQRDAELSRAADRLRTRNRLARNGSRSS
jgi:hypothetical protein